jgi:hypothetical protein
MTMAEPETRCQCRFYGLQCEAQMTAEDLRCDACRNLDGMNQCTAWLGDGMHIHFRADEIAFKFTVPAGT